MQNWASWPTCAATGRRRGVSSSVRSRWLPKTMIPSALKPETVRTLTIVIGLVILLVVLVLGSAVWLFTQSVDVGKADETTAMQEFARVRATFPGVTPVLEVRHDEPVLARKPPDARH